MTITTISRSPSYHLVVDGKDITPTVKPRLISLKLEEARGDTADQLEITLSDHDGALKLQRKGVKVELQLGWADSELVDKGLFIVDEAEHSGAPDVLTIRAKAADMKQSLKARRDQSWHGKTLGDILRTIAARHSLSASVAAQLASVAIAHIDQTESDMNFVTRLAKRYDAVATVKKGALLFLPISGSSTASGARLPTVAITRASGDRHQFSQTDRDSYTGVRAYWHDGAKASRKGAVVGSKTNLKSLPDTYASEAAALSAAKAEWQRIKRGLATFKLTLAVGMPELVPQSPISVQGFKPEIDSTQWLAVRVSHQLDDSGLTTEIECERGVE